MGGPASLIYHARHARHAKHAHGGTSSSSLSALVDRDTVVEASRLATWVFRRSPERTYETPYRDIDVEHVTMSSSVDPQRPAPPLSEAPAFLRRNLDAAIDVALMGVRRAAVMTGGGLDSSVLLGLATRWAERTGGSAFAVSLDYEAEGDDRPHLAALERHLGCEVLRVTPEDAAGRISLMSTGADAAPAGFATMPMEVEMLVRAREHGAERVLSGAGGDEMFGGDPQALADVALRGHPVRAVRSARRLSGFGRARAPAWSWVMRPLIVRSAPTAFRAWRARRRPVAPAPAWAGPVGRAFLDEKQRAARVVPARPRTAAERFTSVRDDAHRVVLAWARHQEEHASGVDCWDPYLDLDLTAAVASLPPEYLLYGDRWRGLLRAAAHDLLPESLRERMDKASFEPALRRWTDAAGGLEALRPLSSGRELAALGLVEPKPFAAAFERFVATPEDGVSWVSLWSALSVEAFLRARAR